MNLALIDWIIIIAFLALTLTIGLALRKRASGSITDYFLSGRKLPWYIAGISMVATTFAADTPLAITEMVAENGISGNWLWWNMLMGGMLTTFFFARLWRKANILTELEFIELRYTGKIASFLRGFKSIYLGVFMNALVIGWVNLALATIIKVFFGLPDNVVVWCVIAAMSLTVIYSSLSGLWGVAITDSIQFFIALAGTVALSIIVVRSPEIGGIEGLKAGVPEGALDFFPQIGKNGNSGTLSITVASFFAFIGIQWWSSWYPGAEPGGGGYIAQRMMSCKDEKNSVFATLFFQIMHFCIRPWPWIIVGLASLILYPDIEIAREGYVMAMKDYLPVGLKGLLLVAFLSAYMSTISTQLNWGASYLINDLYKRFIRKEDTFKNTKQADKHYVLASKLSTIILMFVGIIAYLNMNSISGVWMFIVECGAGLGLVLILRWYWWRINAITELVATIVPFFAFAFSKFFLEWFLYFVNFDLGIAFEVNRGTFYFTVGFTTIAWLLTVFFTKPEDKQHLAKFVERVQPDGAWKPFKNNLERKSSKKNIIYLFICWISAIVMTYSILFSSGKLILAEWQQGFIWLGTAAISLVILLFAIRRTSIVN